MLFIHRRHWWQAWCRELVLCTGNHDMSPRYKFVVQVVMMQNNGQGIGWVTADWFITSIHCYFFSLWERCKVLRSRVCLFVWLASVCSMWWWNSDVWLCVCPFSEVTCPNFTKFSTCYDVTCGRGSVVLWRYAFPVLWTLCFYIMEHLALDVEYISGGLLLLQQVYHCAQGQSLLSSIANCSAVHSIGSQSTEGKAKSSNISLVINLIQI